MIGLGGLGDARARRETQVGRRVAQERAWRRRVHRVEEGDVDVDRVRNDLVVEARVELGESGGAGDRHGDDRDVGDLKARRRGGLDVLLRLQHREIAREETGRRERREARGHERSVGARRSLRRDMQHSLVHVVERVNAVREEIGTEDRRVARAQRDLSPRAEEIEVCKGAELPLELRVALRRRGPGGGERGELDRRAGRRVVDEERADVRRRRRADREARMRPRGDDDRDRCAEAGR